MIDYQQNTPEWLAMRRNKIGASDAPIIMGVSPWRTPYQLWEEKLGLSPGQSVSSSMKRGLDMEESARREFERMTGLIMVPQVVSHFTHEWMIASLDGMDFEGTSFVEIKCAGRTDHETALDGVIPEKYVPQLQHQLEVTGLKTGYYFSFDGQKGVILEVSRDEKYISCLVSKELAFWKCMQDLQTPAMTDKDYKVKSDDMWSEASAEWLTCHQELNRLKAREEELRETLIALSGNSNSSGHGVRVTRVVRKGNVDYSAIPELEDVNLDSYRKAPIESWRIGAAKNSL